MKNSLAIGCHVSAAGGVWNAPKNAAVLGCETFQIFTRPPMGGTAPAIGKEEATRFKLEMDKFDFKIFVVHCPYFVNFGSAEPRIFHGSVSVVKTELERASLLGAKFVMTHLGSAKALGQPKALKQTQEGLVKVLTGYEGGTQFLLEIAAGAGEIIGDSFEELAELMEPLTKFKSFGGICFDTQHAFSSGYDLRTPESVAKVFGQFDKIIGLKWLRMSHMNDSKPDLGERKDRHEHIGEGKIGKKGFEAVWEYFSTLSSPKRGISPLKGEKSNMDSASLPLILETEHDKVETDIKLLKKIRNKYE